MGGAEASGTGDSDAATVSPLLLALGGALVTVAGAGIVGGTYIASTSKRLKEEGVDLAFRKKAIPIAARALAISTGACCATGCLAWLALGLTGAEAQPLRVDAGLQQAITLVRQQRDVISKEIRERQAAGQQVRGEGSTLSRDAMRSDSSDA